MRRSNEKSLMRIVSLSVTERGTKCREAMIGRLIELVVRIWHADSQIRDRSLLGESEFDKRSRRTVGWLCGGTIVVLLLVGLIWWFLQKKYR